MSMCVNDPDWCWVLASNQWASSDAVVRFHLSHVALLFFLTHQEGNWQPCSAETESLVITNVTRKLQLLQLEQFEVSGVRGFHHLLLQPWTLQPHLLFFSQRTTV